MKDNKSMRETNGWRERERERERERGIDRIFKIKSDSCIITL